MLWNFCARSLQRLRLRRAQQLLQLKKLLDDGVITQEEFDVEKAKILKNM